jgi:PKD repeat protein
MKKLLIVLFVFGIIFQSNAYDKKSLVERFTNCSCGPCATINNAWYNATTASLLDSGAITHIIYNVDWPSTTDPMHLLNAADNQTRRRYYAVNAVPWIEINGATIATNQSAVVNAVTSGNSEYAPFSIILTPEVYSNNVINVHVKIIRDPGDNTTFGTTKLRVALLEKRVEFTSPPGSNGERIFYSVCRKMMTDAFGSSFTIPAPGDSTELDLLYIPTTEFLQSVNYDSLKVAAFIQDDDTKEVYQSAMADNLIPSNNVNAAYQVEENLGASPFMVNFSDLSTATSNTNIISWEWDFDNDGTIDSNDPEPTWTYNAEQSYTVKLTVSDGSEQHTRILTDYITVLGAVSDILVVNGISYTTYLAQMEDFYNNSAGFGNHQVDLWDLFGDQNFDYNANPDIQQIILQNQAIPSSILNLYRTVIWIGNSYAGDLTLYDPAQVLDYIGQGGNFLLATRFGGNFFSTELRNYCGISQMSGDSQVNEIIALDDSLTNMTALAGHTFVHFALLDTSSVAIPIFDDNVATNWIAGFRIQKNNDGGFVYIAGRPYRFDNTASYQNYDYIIDNWLNYVPVGVEDETPFGVITDYQLFQNYPNPFNPSTIISYAIPNSGHVTLKIYDLLGREVQILVNEYQEASRYSINFNAGNLSTGIYFYKLQAGNYLETKKMILIK